MLQQASIKTIVIIGTGNLASQLAPALAQKGFTIRALYGRTASSVNKLAALVNTTGVTELDLIPNQADAYLFCLSDDAIPGIAMKLSHCKGIFIHTAGSLNINIFKKLSDHAAVLYPLQTINANKKSNFSNLPFCIEASSVQVLKTIHELASCLSSTVIELTSEERLKIHLSAVFVSNFSNHMYTLASEYLQQNNLSFELLHPLLLETANRAIEIGPKASQTGPARRCDKKTIRKHIKCLAEYPQMQKIYEEVTTSIQTEYK